MGDRILPSAGTGKNSTLYTRLSNPSPVLDKNRAPIGPKILSSTGAGFWRKGPKAFPDSSSVLDKFQPVILVVSVHAVALAIHLFPATILLVRNPWSACNPPTSRSSFTSLRF